MSLLEISPSPVLVGDCAGRDFRKKACFPSWRERHSKRYQFAVTMVLGHPAGQVLLCFEDGDRYEFWPDAENHFGSALDYKKRGETERSSREKMKSIASHEAA